MKEYLLKRLEGLKAGLAGLEQNIQELNAESMRLHRNAIATTAAMQEVEATLKAVDEMSPDKPQADTDGPEET